MKTTSKGLWHRVVMGIAGAALGFAVQAQTVEEAAKPAPGAWTKVTPQGLHFFGVDITPSCSSLPIEGVDTQTFSFWAKRGTTNKLVVFFEGGGACWDAATCLGILPDGSTTDPTFQPFISPTFDPQQLSGIFDTANPANPVRDWSFVYIPYCTGDIHAGRNDQLIDLGPLGAVTVRHRGFDNFLATLHYTWGHFQPQQILVAGSSAGGYGALLNLPWLKLAFPFSQTSVIADSAQAVIPTGWEAIRDAAWNFQLAPWLFVGVPRPVETETIVRRTLSAYPDTKFGQYTTDWDFVQTLFYDIMTTSIGQPQDGTTCEDWESRMRLLVTGRQSERNYRSYIGSGTEHMALSFPKFFTENSAGPLLSEWLGAMLKNRGGLYGHGSPAWQNVTCPGDCGMPPACPF